MSIILKGIDLPEKGEALILKIKDSRIYREYPRYKFQPTRIKDAEAIQIPKDHGDIKDINTVEDELDERCGQLSAEIVRNAPTILEAEEQK